MEQIRDDSQVAVSLGLYQRSSQYFAHSQVGENSHFFPVSKNGDIYEFDTIKFGESPLVR